MTSIFRRRGSLVIWAGFALLLLFAPLVLSSSLSITLLCQMGITIIACLSYNILLGQGGMLSFGHAVYTGLGSFLAIHALNLAAGGVLPVPVSLIPLVGGVAGLGFAAMLGYVSTKKSGTTFAMITLGIGELVFAMSLMFPEFFGGEGGISGNRVMGEPVMGISFGPPRQVYYLIATYTFLSVWAMYAFTQTPLGTMLSAVRDNAERVEFVGYDARRIRYLAFIVSGFFAGISGGLAALNFEIVTAEVVSSTRSGAYLLFTFLGGTTVFFGPIIGAVLMVLALNLFSSLTKAWLLYLGLIFIVMVIYAPGGIASLVMSSLRVVARGRFGPLILHYLAMLAALCLAFFGFCVLVEMIYHMQLDAVSGSELRFLGLQWNTHNPWHWVVNLLLVIAGVVSFLKFKPGFSARWDIVQASLEPESAEGGHHART